VVVGNKILPPPTAGGSVVVGNKTLPPPPTAGGSVVVGNKIQPPPTAGGSVVVGNKTLPPPTTGGSVVVGNKTQPPPPARGSVVASRVPTKTQQAYIIDEQKGSSPAKNTRTKKHRRRPKAFNFNKKVKFVPSVATPQKKTTDISNIIKKVVSSGDTATAVHLRAINVKVIKK
jgi:hypothetical protein